MAFAPRPASHHLRLYIPHGNAWSCMVIESVVVCVAVILRYQITLLLLLRAAERNAAIVTCRSASQCLNSRLSFPTLLIVLVSFPTAMASNPLLSGSIEADEEAPSPSLPKGNIGSSTSTSRPPEVLVPGTSISQGEDGGIVSS
jgi:hypothetical protein